MTTTKLEDYVKVEILRMSFDNEVCITKMETEKDVSVDRKSLRRDAKLMRFDNSPAGKLSCVQYAWVVQTLTHLLDKSRGRKLRVRRWKINVDNMRPLTFGGTLYRDMTFIVAKNVEYRLFAKLHKPVVWVKSKERIKNTSCLQIILRKFAQEHFGSLMRNTRFSNKFITNWTVSRLLIVTRYLNKFLKAVSLMCQKISHFVCYWKKAKRHYEVSKPMRKLYAMRGLINDKSIKG